MNAEFNTLWTEYLDEKDKAKKEEILKKMRANVLQRNDNMDEYKYDIYNKTYSISSANYEQLLRINGDMNMKSTSEEMIAKSEKARDSMMSRNKYTPDNPYPGK